MLILINKVSENMKNSDEREQRQQKLADLFFEMGMDLDLIEKISGVDKRKIIFKRMGKFDKVPLTLKDYDSSMYLENKNSY